MSAHNYNFAFKLYQNGFTLAPNFALWTIFFPQFFDRPQFRGQRENFALLCFFFCHDASEIWYA